MEENTQAPMETGRRCYVRKTLTWAGRRYEVRGRSAEPASLLLAQLLVDLLKGAV